MLHVVIIRLSIKCGLLVLLYNNPRSGTGARLRASRSGLQASPAFASLTARRVVPPCQCKRLDLVFTK